MKIAINGMNKFFFTQQRPIKPSSSQHHFSIKSQLEIKNTINNLGHNYEEMDVEEHWAKKNHGETTVATKPD